MNYTVVWHGVVTICTVSLIVLFFFHSPLPVDVSRSVLLFRNPITNVSGVHRVLSRPPMSRYDMLTVSFSPGDVVESGMCAYVKEKCLGTVSSVFSRTADILLFSAPQAREIFSIGSFVGEGEGLGGGSFRIRVPSASDTDTPVAVGDPIVFQKTGDIIGLVAAVEDKSETASERYVYGHLIVSPFNINDVRLRRV